MDYASSHACGIAAANARREEIRRIEGKLPGRPRRAENITRLSVVFTESEYLTISECAEQQGCAIAAIVRRAVKEFCWKSAGYQRNVTAARARLAELLFKEKAEYRLVTPPEELPSWEWFSPRRRTNGRCLTHELLGDPGRERSALGGWEQKGGAWWEKHSQEYRDEMRVERIEPSKPLVLADKIAWPIGGTKLSAAAIAVVGLSGCRFPCGEIGAPDFHFCNEKRRAGSSYCAHHSRICERRR